jgi:hypothetical protein
MRFEMRLEISGCAAAMRKKHQLAGSAGVSGSDARPDPLREPGRN